MEAGIADKRLSYPWQEMMVVWTCRWAWRQMNVPENNLDSGINKLGDELIVEKGKKSGHPYF